MTIYKLRYYVNVDNHVIYDRILHDMLLSFNFYGCKHSIIIVFRGLSIRRYGYVALVMIIYFITTLGYSLLLMVVYNNVCLSIVSNVFYNNT